MRSVLFTAFALTVAHPLSAPAAPPVRHLLSSSGARVSVSMDSFEALAPERAYTDLIEEAAARYGVDAKLIRSVIRAESAFDPWAVSRAGAQGLMQLMPQTSLAYGVADPFDPRENIMAGTRVLRELLDLYRDDLSLVLASYNAGAGVVAEYGGIIPPFEETENYVKRVQRFLATND